jgi:hypothetical protein
MTRPQSQFPHSSVCEQFINSQDRSKRGILKWDFLAVLSMIHFMLYRLLSTSLVLQLALCRRLNKNWLRQANFSCMWLIIR